MALTLLEIKRHLRSGRFTWPGGYPLYFITRDGGTLCFDCVRKEWRNVVDDFLRDMSSGWRVEAVDVNWEQPDLHCDHCAARLESAYGADTDLEFGAPESDFSRASHYS